MMFVAECLSFAHARHNIVFQHLYCCLPSEASNLTVGKHHPNLFSFWLQVILFLKILPSVLPECILSIFQCMRRKVRKLKFDLVSKEQKEELGKSIYG